MQGRAHARRPPARGNTETIRIDRNNKGIHCTCRQAERKRGKARAERERHMPTHTHTHTSTHPRGALFRLGDTPRATRVGEQLRCALRKQGGKYPLFPSPLGASGEGLQPARCVALQLGAQPLLLFLLPLLVLLFVFA